MRRLDVIDPHQRSKKKSAKLYTILKSPLFYKNIIDARQRLNLPTNGYDITVLNTVGVADEKILPVLGPTLNMSAEITDKIKLPDQFIIVFAFWILFDQLIEFPRISLSVIETQQIDIKTNKELSLLGNCLISIHEKVSKKEVLEFIEFNWKTIEKTIEKEGKYPEIKMSQIDLASKIVNRRVNLKQKFKNIADELENDSHTVIDEDYTKVLYHRFANIITNLQSNS